MFVMWSCSQKEVDHELEENNAELERLQGSNLVYGEKIQVSSSNNSVVSHGV